MSRLLRFLRRVSAPNLLYVETWSLALDIAIMMTIVLAVLRRGGAC